MVFIRSDTFTGREDDLLKLAEGLLHKPNSIPITITAAATVQGGLGKTQLAVEFAYRFWRYFYGIHWINALNDFDAEVAACGATMNLPNFPATQPEQVALTLASWGETPPRLVILDNAEDPALVREWLPRLDGLRVLLTSRRSNWPKDIGIHELPLETLTNESARELLRKLASHLETTSDAELDAVIERLGGLPLALDLAGRYMADMRGTPADYLKELDVVGNPLEHPSLVDWVKDGNATAHDTNVAASYLVSWRQVEDATIRTLFAACGFMAPNQLISRDLLGRFLMEDAKAEPDAAAMQTVAVGTH
jgi:hypothetical protein